MVQELCPKCRQLRNAKLSVATRKVSNPGGKIKEITTTSFHCEECGAFIRSEDTEESGKNVK